MANHDVHFSSLRSDWETPQKFFDELHQEFSFNIDLAANASNHKTPLWFGPDSPLGISNSLHTSWHGYRGWLNPPYGRLELPKWIEKAYEDSRHPGTLIVMLVPARTDTIAWHEYVIKAQDVRFVRGRLKFVGAKHGAPFPSAVIVFGVSQPSISAKLSG